MTSASSPGDGPVSINYNEAYPNSEYSPSIKSSVHGKVMRMAAAGVCYVNGFDSSSQSALEIISQLMSSYMLTLCNATKQNIEVAGRTQPILTDVWVALVNLGHNVDGLPDFLRAVCRGGNLVIPPPRITGNASQHSTLRVGKTRSHPAHINGFLPPFPDPHTYIRTEISGEPDTSYEKVRELHAQRKRDTETLLVDYMLRVHPRTCLFREYETKVREEARAAIRERERNKEALKAAKKAAKVAEKMKAATKMENPHEMPDDILMEDDFLEQDGDKEESNDGSQGASISDEEVDFDLEETETSLILRRIPAFCSVLDPSLESRPYLSALVCDEINDDEGTETAAQASQSSQNSRDGEEQAYDNAFLRPPRMPAKGNFVQF